MQQHVEGVGVEYRAVRFPAPVAMPLHLLVDIPAALGNRSLRRALEADMAIQ
jgi:hypothetical protein